MVSFFAPLLIGLLTAPAVAPSPVVQVRAERLHLPAIAGTPLARGARLERLRVLNPGAGTTAPGAIDAASVVVRREADGAVLKPGSDYLVDPVWGTIAVGPAHTVTPSEFVLVDYRYRLQRVDSLIIQADGTQSVRAGTAQLTSPQPPELSAGETRLANLYVGYGGDGRSPPLFPVLETAAQAHTRSQPGLIPRTLAKLQAGKPVTVVCWGDSVTVGFEASRPEKAYSQLLAHRLAAAFPRCRLQVKVVAVSGSKSPQWLDAGGAGQHAWKRVEDAKPDLITVEFVNDAGLGSEVWQAEYGELLARAKKLDAELILITPHFTNLSMMHFQSLTEPESRPYVRFLVDFAAAHHLAVADASSRWEHLWKEGLPYTTLLHNGINHPDDRGHEIFAEELMKCFAGAFPAHSSAVDVSAIEHLRPALPVIPPRTFQLGDFGGTGDGRTLNTAAFARAIAAVAQAGGGRLVVPAGVFVTGPFVLCSSLDLHLDPGAVIRAPATFGELGLPEPSTLHSQAEASAVRTPQPLITGSRLHDVALTGAGTIDGSGAHWWAWSERASRAQPGRVIFTRPHLIEIQGCERLLVSDLTLTNSSRFHLVPRDITDLTIERIKVRAPFNAPNTDAIDPGPGRNFWIHDCDIDTGDDDIVIKSGGTNILIENNTIHHGHGISIGSPTMVGIHNMLVRHCTFDGADNGIRIKSMRGAGGVVENVRYTDIQMKRVGAAILLDMSYVDNNRPNFKGDPALIPDFHDILIDHVTIDGARSAGKISGLPGHPIANVTLREVSFTAESDLVATDATNLVFENVRRTILPPAE